MYPKKPVRFQRSQLRLLLSVVCTSLTLGSATIVKLADTPALSQMPNRTNSPNRSPAPAVIRSIRQTVKQQFEVSQIIVVRVDEQIWPDGCLGLAKAREVCTSSIVPGWQAIVTSPDVTYVYHLSQNADRIVQNETASGAKRAITVSLEMLAKISPLSANEIFRSEILGDMTGRSTRIVLTADGKVTRYESSFNAKFAPVLIKTLSREQLNTFKKLLENRQFPNLNGLSYTTSAMAADGTSTLYQSQSTAIHVVDRENKNLPRSLQQTSATWDWATAPVKSKTSSR